jgi:hypothetical protein
LTVVTHHYQPTNQSNQQNTPMHHYTNKTHPCTITPPQPIHPPIHRPTNQTHMHGPHRLSALLVNATNGVGSGTHSTGNGHRWVHKDGRFLLLIDRLDAQSAHPAGFSSQSYSKMLTAFAHLDYVPPQPLLHRLRDGMQARIEAQMDFLDPYSMSHVISAFVNLQYHPGDEFLALFAEVRARAGDVFLYVCEAGGLGGDDVMCVWCSFAGCPRYSLSPSSTASFPAPRLPSPIHPHTRSLSLSHTHTHTRTRPSTPINTSLTRESLRTLFRRRPTS